MSQEDMDLVAIADSSDKSFIETGYVVSSSFNSVCWLKLGSVAPGLCVQTRGAQTLSILLLFHYSEVLPLPMLSKMAH